MAEHITNNDEIVTTIALKDILLERETRAFHVYYNIYDVFIGNPASKSARSAAIKALVYHILALTARAVPTAVIAGGISLTAIFGLVIAYKANELLQIQNLLSESQRRALASTEITAINDSIVEATCDKGLSNCINISENEAVIARRVLPAVLEARIIAALNAANPYRFIDMERTAAEPSTDIYTYRNFGRNVWNYIFGRDLMLSDLTSPERGNLLLVLSEAHVEISRIASRGSFSFAALEGADLSNLQMGRSANSTAINLSNSILRRAKLDHVQWSGVDASRSDIRGASFDGSTLNGFTCEDCNGSPINHRNTQYNLLLRPKLMSGGGFINSNLRNSFMNMGSVFEDVLFMGVGGDMILTGVNMDGSSFRSKNKLGDAAFTSDNIKFLKMDQISAVATKFELVEINAADLSGSNLTNAQFIGSALTGCKLDGAKLNGASFRDTTVECSVTDADFECADFSQSRISDEIVRTARNWKLAKFSSDQTARLGLDPLLNGCLIPRD